MCTCRGGSTERENLVGGGGGGGGGEGGGVNKFFYVLYIAFMENDKCS